MMYRHMSPAELSTTMTTEPHENLQGQFPQRAGMVRVSKQLLEQVLTLPAHTIRIEVYDQHDGTILVEVRGADLPGIAPGDEIPEYTYTVTAAQQFSEWDHHHDD